MDTTARLSQLSLILLGLLALFAALDHLQDIAAPVALALVAGIVLSPVSDFWERLSLPGAAGALLTLLTALLVIGMLVLLFQPVVMQLVDQWPKIWADMQDIVRLIRSTMRGLSDVSDSISDAIVPEAKAATDTEGEAGLAVPTVADAIMLAPSLLGQIMTFAGALFFFVLTRSEIYAWIARRLTEPANRGPMAMKLRHAERQVSQYFLTISLINAGLGLATALAMAVLGMPGAVIWGLVAFLANFVVYLGPAVYVLALIFGGAAVFDGIWSFAPAAAFVILNGIEGQFVTPTLLGRSLSVNALVIFLALVFGIWIWGAIGGIVAMPLLLWFTVISKDLPDAT